MNPEINSALSQLNDLYIPEAVGWWPPSQTLIGLVTGLGGIIIGLSWYWWKQRRLNQYRGQAMDLLQSALKQATHPQQQIQATNKLLKQVAITHYGRARVAALNGQAWLNFLQETARYIDQPDAMQSFVSAHYQPKITLDEAELKTCLDYAGKWIKGHHK